ncbi:hypothetical protein KDH_59880 [Dictyobacter sp. S3.2.2.5]|uniref:Uncharacterized protein n=1 Tax=Dictyobacter halimunensis TaxID=3026934 RepID=A0ABQ6FY00_9CHLR|nr:hypothetical protein KDH_59880 [Dictyobacter sp. S3.2.2.5]
MPGKTFKAVATSDGQWIFVSFNGNDAATSGIAVLHEQGSQICLQHVIPLSGMPFGMTLSHDDRILAIADYSNVAFMDVAQAERGTKGALLGYVPEHPSSSTIEVALSPDEQDLFAANENDGTVSVIDFQRIRAHDFSAHALIGQLPLGVAPVGMAISPDNRFLYITSEADKSLSSSTQAAKMCGGYPQGSLSVAAIARVRQDPAHAIIARAASGCGPVRVVLSPSGTLAWVTARGNNAVLTFDTTRLITNQKNARLASTTVGTAPVGAALIDKGSVLVVANSNRFLQPYTPQHLTVLNTKQALDHKAAVLTSINVGDFPRELTLEANGQTLLLTNYNSQTLSIIDVSKLPGAFSS